MRANKDCGRRARAAMEFSGLPDHIHTLGRSAVRGQADTRVIRGRLRAPNVMRHVVLKGGKGLLGGCQVARIQRGLQSPKILLDVPRHVGLVERVSMVGGVEVILEVGKGLLRRRKIVRVQGLLQSLQILPHAALMDGSVSICCNCTY